MTNKIISFEDLRVWQVSHRLALDIYTLTSTFPNEELYGLTSQLRRAATSVPANIVEGFYRNTTKELILFLFNARGSAGEVIYLLVLSKDLRYIHEGQYITLKREYQNLIKSINALISSLKNK